VVVGGCGYFLKKVSKKYKKIKHGVIKQKNLKFKKESKNIN